MKQSLDFIVVGAQKSGTTTLFEHLRRHPELHLPPGKEAPFFSDDDHWRGGWELYVRRYFGGAREGARWGTVTPQYMYGTLSRTATDPATQPERIVPERIAAHSPNARLVAILRDPVERAFSHYRMEVMRETEHRSFAEAVDELLNADRLAASRRRFAETAAYVTNGEYGRILAPYFELFGDQVHVVFSADLATDPAGTVAAVTRFIGVDGGFRPATLGQRYRAGAARRRFRGLNLYTVQETVAATPAIRAAWRALPGRVRTRIDDTFKEAAYQLDVRNRVVVPEPERPSPELEARLREHYAEDRETLKTLTGLEPPW